MAEDGTRDSALHYQQGGIEPLEYIRAQGWLEGFCCGNAVKYVTRYKFKGGPTDLVKAREYINILLEAVRAEETGSTGSHDTD